MAVSEIAKRNGKGCTSVNCGAKANRRSVGVALAVALSLSMAGGGVAWAEDEPVTGSPKTITSADTSANETVYRLDRTGSTIDGEAGTGVKFILKNGGTVKAIRSYKSGNLIEIENGGNVSGYVKYPNFYVGIHGGISNNKITVYGDVLNDILGGYSEDNNGVTNNKIIIDGGSVTGVICGGADYLTAVNLSNNSVAIKNGTAKKLRKEYIILWIVL